jgi:hypothetical protein
MNRIVTAVIVLILSVLLLGLFPFYPIYLVIGLGVLLGLLGLELPSLALMLAVLLSVFGAFYQNPFIGLTFLVVLVVFASLTQTWIELGLLSATWLLAMLILPPLAIAPTILAGLHYGRQQALKIGILAAITTFLLTWSVGSARVALMPIVNHAAMYVPKPIPNPWQFAAFIPDPSILTTSALSAFFGPLGAAVSDFRFYIFIAVWAVAGYLAGFLAGRFKRQFYVPAAVAGVVPLLAVSFIFGAAAPLDLGVALVGAVVAGAVYRVVQSFVQARELGMFTRLQDLIPGGLPEKYSVLLGSPVCEERNLVIEQFLQLDEGAKSPSYLLTSDLDFARATVEKYGEQLTVLVANQRAASVTGAKVIPITSGPQNLTTINIELVKAVRNVASKGGRVCLDILSDILLTQKMLTTRKWVTDLVPRLDEWGFTTLGVFNPSLHSPEDTTAMVDLFKGYMQISDQEIAGKTRKTITVRKMTGLQYSEAQLVVDREALGRRKRKSRFAR